ncbi:MAG: D-alanine--D-alanine ligase family protein [Myxococcota bacterium]
MALTVGLVYDLLGTHPRTPGDPPDVDAEYEPEETVALLEAALARLGHRSVRVGSPHQLLAALGKGELPALDAALSIAEGHGGRNREAWAPVLLDMAGVPTLGSDALTLSATLDKGWACRLVEAAGVPVAEGCSVASAAEAENVELPWGFPSFVKPLREGTAKGIRPSSRVESRAALVGEVARIVGDYAQPARVERFLPGAEYTVTVVGHAPPRALPVLQRALEEGSRIGVHAVERHAPREGWRTIAPGDLDPRLEATLARLALRAFETLECLDFARVDFRLDADDRPRFLEINPLPTFAPDGSFGILAELEGRPAEALLADVFGEALARIGLGLS